MDTLEDSLAALPPFRGDVAGSLAKSNSFAKGTGGPVGTVAVDTGGVVTGGDSLVETGGWVAVVTGGAVAVETGGAVAVETGGAVETGDAVSATTGTAVH